MSTTSLTAKYRPQTFAEVAGQDTLKSILSRASLEDRVAPAYLFSGTRGVGKTTLARIFAKALNCRHAPAAEPCNNCDQCHAVTSGSAVDVIEIDGASNRGIDDVRRLKEVVGYAPMEGRYKIFIIDEAHMLSREAFNALLKTLEEPPARVTFIMATTEPHKFPATIISRCQHYVFKRLPDAGLIAHLSTILNKEGISFEESAVSLIARRGAGSVRDSMSLLGQVLALGDGDLTEASARNVLGLAGQEALLTIVKALAEGQTLPLTRALTELLDQGLDVGFFLRELAGLWRNLFILKQSGEAGKSVIDIPESQKSALFDITEDFSLSHIHACWQMTLEGQRRVLTSLEPGLALELLLLNLAMLPELLSLDGLSALARRSNPQLTQRAKPTPPSHERNTSQYPATIPQSNQQPSFTKEVTRENNVFQSQRSFSGQPANKATDTKQNMTSNSSERERPKTTGSIPPPWDDTPGQPKPSHLHSSQKQNEKAHTTDQEQSTYEGKEHFTTSNSFPSTSNSFSSYKEDSSNTFENTAFDNQDSPSLLKYESELKENSPLLEHSVVPKDSVTSDNFEKETTHKGALLKEVSQPQESQAPKSYQRDGTLSLVDTLSKKDSVFTHIEWDTLVEWCINHDAPTWFIPLIKNATAIWRENTLLLQPKDAFAGQRLVEAEARKVLDPALIALCGGVPEIEILEPVYKKEDQAVIKEKIYAHPAVKVLEEVFEARVIDFGQVKSRT